MKVEIKGAETLRQGNPTALRAYWEGHVKLKVDG